MDLLFDHRLKYSGGVVTDGRGSTGLSFVSSAEVPGAWRFDKPLCTEITAGLLSTIRREFRPLILPCGRAMNIGPLRVVLYPAGPLPGAAVILVQQDGFFVAFCAGQPDDSVILPPCDILAAVVTSSAPDPESQTLATLVDSARTAIRAGLVPVVRCNPFGAARSVCHALSDAGITVRAHQGILRFNRAWRVRGNGSGLATGFRGGDATGGAVVLPAHLGPSPLESGIRNPWRISVVRAGDESMPVVPADLCLTLPGAVDSNGLGHLVSMTRARSVVLTGEGARHCANILAGRGIAATVVDPVHQVELL